MFCKITSANVIGTEGQICDVEIDTSKGIPFFNMVGLLSSESKEAKDRVRIAIKNSGYGFDNKKITVNISPANIKKSGTAFDLPICIGLLYNMGQIKRYLGRDVCIIGEVSLNGEVNHIKGVTPMIEAAKDYGCKYCLVPYKNYHEARFIDGVDIIGVSTLKDAVEKINNRDLDVFVDKNLPLYKSKKNNALNNFEEIKSQKLGVRAALIAASGGHNLMLTGQNGIGKTMISQAILGILPPMNKKEKLECTKIHSIAGLLDDEYIVTHRPFRAPHQSITSSALIGGGYYPTPGEISLAHNGILYLEEMALFKASVLNSLRTPLESKSVQISRNSGNYNFPANTMIVASMNCCPCGAFPDTQKCTCSPNEIKRYRSKISNPIIDRFDLFCFMRRPKLDAKLEVTYTSEDMKKMVKQARILQKERNPNAILNAELNSKDILEVCMIGDDEYTNFATMIEKLKISMRGYVRVLKIARTIADIEGSRCVLKSHLNEALIFERNRGDI